MVQVCNILRLDSLSHSGYSVWDFSKNYTCDMFFKKEERQKKQVQVSGVKNLLQQLVWSFMYLCDMISN